MNTDKVLDDAREKIAKKLYKQRWYESQPPWKDSKLKSLFRNYARQILALSGTTDIECPKCVGYRSTFTQFSSDGYMDCPKCDNGIIPYKWKVSVTLENGELPKLVESGDEPELYTCGEVHRAMLNAKYRQVVE